MPYKVHPVIFTFKIKISKYDSDNESRVYKPQSNYYDSNEILGYYVNEYLHIFVC